MHTDKAGNTYYAVFNYGETPLTMQIPLSRIGINTKKFKSAKEMLSGEQVNLKSKITIQPKDVMLIKSEN